MFGKSHIFRKLFSNVYGTGLRRRVLGLTLLLALGVGGVAPQAPAQAAPLTARISYLFRAQLPRGPICAGRDYDVMVKITKFFENWEGTDWGRISGGNGLNFQRVEGSVVNPDIGTLVPSISVTGGLLGEAGDVPGEAFFKFHANKAGNTILKFEVEIRDYNGGVLEYDQMSLEKEIKVENCKYKVTMTNLDVASSGGVTIWTSGNLDLEISGDGGEMTGSGDFAHDSGFVGPPCSITYSEFKNPTTITGQVNDGQLTLQFNYEPGTINSQVTCPDLGALSGSQVIDLTNTGVVSATFPESGGSRSFRYTYAGSDFPPGTMIVTVAPVAVDE
jgi:hypothetical protein